MQLDEIVSWTATVLGFGLKASPVVLFYQIAIGNKKIEIVPEMLIICNILSAELWLSYWLRIGNKMAPIVSSSVSFILGVIFSIIYLYYFSEKRCSKLFIYTLMEFGSIALLYYTLSLTELKIVGFVANCVNILNFISPAQRILRVCREKNYSLIPIATTVLGCISSFLWLVFGILIFDLNVIIPNTLSVLISLFNTSIWIYFYCTAKEKKGKDTKEKEEEMIETNRGDDEEMKEI